MEISITLKRKYEKKSNEGKITVKHYLNTRLKPVTNEKSLLDGKARYPVYVRAILLGKTFDMKSRISFPVSIDEFESVLIVEKDFFNIEIKEITKIIKGLNPFNQTSFDFKKVIYRYNFLSLSLQDSIENTLKEKIIDLIDIGLSFFSEEHNNSISGEIKLDLEKQQIKYDIAVATKKIKSRYDEILIEKFNKGFKVKESLSYILIEYLTINDSEEFRKMLKNYDDFINLKNRYSLLWVFWGNYFPKILIKSRQTKISTNDWFLSNTIQKIIIDIYPEDGQQMINQINDLFSLKNK